MRTRLIKIAYFGAYVHTGSAHISTANIPRHIAIVMDGNGRWAQGKGAARVFGHRNAIKAVRDATLGCGELGVKFLTLYVFSTENWGRPQPEVEALMSLLVDSLKKETDALNENRVRLRTIGDLSRLPKACRRNLQEAVEATRENEDLNLVLALSYSGRWEIVEAARALAHDVRSGAVSQEDIDGDLFASYLKTADIPDPELLIRTGGEMRISNFLLWQIAYTELYVTNTLWPDFSKNDLYDAVRAYQNRERRFGKIATSA